MRALLTKEWKQLQPGATVAAVAVAILWLWRAGDVSFAPSQALQVAWFAFAVLAGTVVGYYQLGVERSGQTWELLLSRPLSPAHVVAAKVVAGWAALALVLVAPVLLTACAGAAGLIDAPNLRGRRLIELLCLAFAATSAHGLGALATTWNLPAQLRGGAALLGMVGLMLLAAYVTILEWGEFWPRILGLAMGHVVVGLAGWTLAGGGLRGRDGLDALVSPGRATALAAAATVFLAVPFLALIGLLESALVRAIYEDYRQSVALEFLKQRAHPEEGERRDIVWTPRPTGSRAWLEQAEVPRWPATFHTGELWGELSETEPGVPLSLISLWGWLNRTTGEVRLSGGSGWSNIHKRPDRAFSRETIPVGVRSGDRTAAGVRRAVLLYDPADSTLWIVPLTGRPRRIRPPEGDEIVDVEAPSREETEPWPSRPFTFVGLHRPYRWTGGALVPAEDAPPASRPVPLLRIEDGHTVRPTVTAFDSETESVVERRSYRPGGDQLAGYLALQAIALVRPPAVVASSYFRSGPLGATDVNLLSEQQVWEGHRLDLVVLNVLVAAGFAAHAARRLRRLGASGARRGAWMGVILTLGYAGYLVFRLVEPRPRRAGVVDGKQPAPLLVDGASPVREVATCARS